MMNKHTEVCVFCVRRIHLGCLDAQLNLYITHKEQVTKQFLIYLRVLMRLAAYQGLMMVKAMRQHKEAQRKWHNSCRLQSNKTSLKYVEKKSRSTEDVGYSHSSRFTCKSLKEISSSVETCFFCYKPTSSRGPYVKHEYLELILKFDSVP